MGHRRSPRVQHGGYANEGADIFQVGRRENRLPAFSVPTSEISRCLGCPALACDPLAKLLLVSITPAARLSGKRPILRSALRPVGRPSESLMVSPADRAFKMLHFRVG
jgi:hypothetical protein